VCASVRSSELEESPTRVLDIGTGASTGVSRTTESSWKID
jgi:hypothetical protein